VRGRPIIFSAESVRAILAGRKSQTRRVIKPQPEPWACNEAFLTWSAKVSEELMPLTLSQILARCPYGVPSGRLYVKEGWAESESDAGPVLVYRAGGHALIGADGEKRSGTWVEYLIPAADVGAIADPARWRSPIHMPRWASRLTLELAEVRVQRLQEISEEDARAEGFEPSLRYVTARDAFWAAWNQVQLKTSKPGGKSWADNSWVWALSFKVVS
jgi:hypothetical protein